MHYSELRGAIFDVDDTLLDNHPDGTPFGLHHHSRLAAAHEVGRQHNIPGLQALTKQQSIDSFRDAKTHTLHGAVWQMLLMAGTVKAEEPDLQHPLLLEIVELKDELHENSLRTQGRALPGAVQFVRALAQSGLAGRLGVASTAYRRDIDIFFEMTRLDELFLDKQIISRERFTRPKPDPEPFDLSFRTLGLSESDRPYVVAFEDDPRGILSAKTAGLFTCAITTQYDRHSLASLETPPDLIADSYAEFAEHFGL